MKSVVRLAYAVVAASALFINGCAGAATVQGMTVPVGQAAGATAPEMEKAVAVADFGGGGTNSVWSASAIEGPAFKSALEHSLASAGMLGPQQTARYAITASLVSLDQPAFGLAEMTATSKIRYTVTDTKSRTVVFDETITSEHSSGPGDSPLGAVRMRIATEGSARKSIATLIGKLRAGNMATRNVALAR